MRKAPEATDSAFPALLSEPLGPAEFVGGVNSFAETNAMAASHAHHGFEIDTLIEGSQERYWEGHVRPALAGDVCLNAPWEPHGWRTTHPDSRALYFVFKPEYLGDESFEGVSWLSLFAAPPERRPRLSSEGRAEVLVIAAELASELEERPWGWQVGVRQGVLRLLLKLGRLWDEREGVPRPPRHTDLSRIMPALRLVHGDTHRRIDRAEAARACGLSVSQFRFIFHRTIGISFGRFALQARVAHAAHQLLRSAWPAERIARESGFIDASHLHRAFAKVYGCTPTQFRARHS